MSKRPFFIPEKFRFNRAKVEKNEFATQQRIVILFQDCPCLPQNQRFYSLCLEMLYLNGCFDITLFLFNIP